MKFSWLGRVVKAPGRVIDRGKDAVVQALITKLVMKGLRHALTAGGGAGIALSEDQTTQIASAVSILVGVAWSAAEAFIDSRKQRAQK